MYGHFMESYRSLDKDLNEVKMSLSAAKNQEDILNAVLKCNHYIKKIKSVINTISKSIEESEIEIMSSQFLEAEKNIIILERSIEQIRIIKNQLIKKATQLTFDEKQVPILEKLIWVPLLSIEDRVHLSRFVIEECRKNAIVPPAAIFNFLKEKFNKAEDKDVYALLQSMKEGRRISIPNVSHSSRGPLLHINQDGRIKDLSYKSIVFNPDELSDYQIIINKGLLKQRQGAHFVPFDTSGMVSHKKEGFAAFVINAKGQLFSFQHKEGEDYIFHSSFSAIQNNENQIEQLPVMAAGELCVIKGELKAITAHSGHYQPNVEEMYQLLNFFNRQRINLEGVGLCIFDDMKELGLNGIKQKIGREDMYVFNAHDFYTHIKPMRQKEAQILLGILENYITTTSWKVKGGGKKIKCEAKEISVPTTVYSQWLVIQETKGKDSKSIDWEDVHYRIKKLAEEALLTPKPGSFFGLGKREPETVKYLIQCSNLSAGALIQYLKQSQKALAKNKDNKPKK